MQWIRRKPLENVAIQGSHKRASHNILLSYYVTHDACCLQQTIILFWGRFFATLSLTDIYIALLKVKTYFVSVWVIHLYALVSCTITETSTDAMFGCAHIHSFTHGIPHENFIKSHCEDIHFLNYLSLPNTLAYHWKRDVSAIYRTRFSLENIIFHTILHIYVTSPRDSNNSLINQLISAMSCLSTKMYKRVNSSNWSPFPCGPTPTFCKTRVYLPHTMRDKSVETLSFKGYFGVCYSIITASHKKLPPPLPPKQCWISHCTNDGLCSGTTLNWGEGL